MWELSPGKRSLYGKRAGKRSKKLQEGRLKIFARQEDWHAKIFPRQEIRQKIFAWQEGHEMAT